MTDAPLDTLARAEPTALKAFAEGLIPHLGDIEVRRSRTALVMLPMRDTAQGTNFHLGEVLVSEAQIERQGTIGYGMVRGHDLERAMAMALVDLALTAGVQTNACSDFIDIQSQALAAADETRLRKVEATRVNMETF